jgi:hypothetical protein
MPILTQYETQVVELFHQLPGQSQRRVLLTLAANARTDHETRMQYAESQLRRLCQERGLNWDMLTEDEREQFIDDLLHEA